jgi:hypothetical protein
VALLEKRAVDAPAGAHVGEHRMLKDPAEVTRLA